MSNQQHDDDGITDAEINESIDLIRRADWLKQRGWKPDDSEDVLANSLAAQVKAVESQRDDLLALCREMVATLTMERNRPLICDSLWFISKRWSERLTVIVAANADRDAGESAANKEPK